MGYGQCLNLASSQYGGGYLALESITKPVLLPIKKGGRFCSRTSKMVVDLDFLVNKPDRSIRIIIRLDLIGRCRFSGHRAPQETRQIYVSGHSKKGVVRGTYTHPNKTQVKITKTARLAAQRGRMGEVLGLNNYWCANLTHPN